MKYILFVLLSLSNFSFAQSPLQLEEIMAGNSFIGHQPNHIKWSPDNETILYSWQQIEDKIAHQYLSKPFKNSTEKLSIQQAHSLPTDGFETNHTKTAFYFKKFDKIFYYSKNKTVKLIYQSATPFRIQKIINDEKIVIRQNDAFFLINHKAGYVHQLIKFKSPNTKDDHPDQFLERQQTELFDFIKAEQKNNTLSKIKDSINQSLQVPTYETDNRITLFEIDSNLSFSIFRIDEYNKNKKTHIEKWITQSGYTEPKNARSKVGSKTPVHTLVWMDLNTRESNNIDISNLPGIFSQPRYLKIYDPDFELKSKSPKAVIYTQIKMNSAGSLALIEIKSYDNKDRWIVMFDIVTKTLSCIDHQHDEAWIGGPGISGWNMVPGNIGWMDNDQSIFFISEKTGYAHLYQHVLKTGKTKTLTKGNFEIYTAELSLNDTKFYITANKTHPGNRGFYHLNTKPIKWTPIFEEDGNFQVMVSPDERNLAILYSYKNKPWELYCSENISGAKMTQITNSTSKAFNSYKWRAPEVVTFKNQENNTIYARIFKPDPSKKNGAAVQFVHGAGYLQNAHNWWSAYHREYMFHNLLADKGYTVIDIDYSASKGYGRNFRTAIYRHMGGQDLEDQISGRQYLIENENIDSNKIGIYGGSYGGFITIMALLKYPGYFQCGAAIRSVTDWAHYNHAYTSNILNTPETDSIAFRRSSPIYFAENLKDQLLILHGMVDDNVQFQDVVRLNQRFIELGKKSFSMALYPVEPHGFVKTSSWIDEYSRILNLFEENLN